LNASTKVVANDERSGRVKKEEEEVGRGGGGGGKSPRILVA